MFFHCLSISIIAYHYLSLPIILYHYISIVLCRYVCTIICNYLPRCFIYHHRLSCVSAVFYPSAVFTYRTIAWLINFDLIIALACSSHLSWSISIHLHPSPSISIYFHLFPSISIYLHLSPSIHLSIFLLGRPPSNMSRSHTCKLRRWLRYLVNKVGSLP